MKDLFAGKRVFVTGGSGVIGKELLKLLMGTGADTLNIDREPLPSGDWSGVHHVQKDLVLDSLEEFIEFKPQIIFHLAAEFERSIESPEFWETNWKDNVRLGHRIADIVKNIPECEVFVFASSYLIYDPALYMTNVSPKGQKSLHETDYVKPRNICGAAKFYTEREMEFINEHFNPNMRLISSRIFRVFGLDSREIINRWVREVLAGKKIKVYNKQNRFDYIFSRDVAEGILRLAASPKAQGVVNLSFGFTRSIEDVLNILTTHLPQIRTLIQDNGTLGQCEVSCGDITLFKQLTGWSPQTTLEQGIEMIIKNEKAKKEIR